MVLLEISTTLAKIISELIIAVKSSNTQWMENNIETIYKNRSKKEMLELDLQEQIKKRKAEIQQDLNKISLQYEGELKRVQMEVDQITRNYADFLKALDSTKAEIVATFKDSTPITALLIHHHASGILNKMWNEADQDKRALLEGQLLDLFSSVADDINTLNSSPAGTYCLPEKTLKLIQGKKH
jgi:hypothetical protein